MGERRENDSGPQRRFHRKSFMIPVVLTSFEPFGGHAVNSSLEVARTVARRPPSGIDLNCVVLPVVVGVCVEQAWSCIKQTKPALVLALGQAAGAASLRIERVAVNWHDFPIADNAGNQPQWQLIEARGPAVCRGTIRERMLRRTLQDRNIAAKLSDTAGTYVCNHLYYRLLHRAKAARCDHQTGFIHLPLLPGQVDRRRPEPSMNLEQLVQGIRLAITACLEAGRNEE
jgi:pyroglutamyl-peptidase